MPPYPSYPSEGWILDEDRALRDLMKGMVVSDHEKKERHVEAWFGHPDQELREQKYPYVTVDLLQIQEGIGRVHRGNLYTAGEAPWWGLPPLSSGSVGYLLEMPTPVDLDYQISTWARNPRHDRQMIQQMILGDRTRLRGGLLYTADHRIRRLDFLGHVKRDTVEGGKRLHNNIFRVRISSEVPWGWVANYLNPVKHVEVQVRGFLEELGIPYYDASLFAGLVDSWDSSNRTASIIIGDDSIHGVPIVSYIRPPASGEYVRVSRESKVQNPSTLDDYRFLIIGIE